MQYMSRRQRLITVAMAVALALSLGGTILLTIAWLHDRDAARVALADDSRRLQALEIKVGSLTADGTGTPVQATVAPPAASISTPSPSGAPARSATPTQSPANLVFARLTHVTDSLGSDWINAPVMGQQVHLKAGTTITFTAFATDELNRQLQFEFWRGESPAQQILCGWGAASCTWTAVTPSAACGPCNPTTIHVAVRDSAATHRLSPCFKTESCDDLQTLQYDIEPW
jgi:hypothetical protein